MRTDSAPLRTYPTLALLVLSLTTTSYGQFLNFVTARGDRLMDGTEELRFVSFNIPNLHYIEDNLVFNEPNQWRIADAYEIQDALTSIKQLGGKVTRLYVPSVRKEIDDSTIIRHVEGPGMFNEEAFRAYDRVLETANRTGVRLIVPFVDNWWWWGGPKEYARFRGKKREEFWTDSLLIADFKKTIAFMITRVNTVTGVPYREDKAILAWETGNELEAPSSWTKEIAAYIKSLDTNHLVIDGSRRGISDEALADPNIDVLTTHHYSPRDVTIATIIIARNKTRGKKPYFIGEFGFQPTADMRTVIDTVMATGLSGLMVWSLRFHNRDGGFYFHAENNNYADAYHWPGFASGNAVDETAVFQLVREKAFQINKRQPDPFTPPDPPRMLPVETPYKISWRGSTGAASYLVERKSEDDILWKVVASNVSDANNAYRPLFADTTVELGKKYLYRVQAKGLSGYSEPSEPVGPVTAGYRMLIDDLDNDSKFYAKSDGVRFLTRADVVRAKEDKGRITGGREDFVVYKLPGTVSTIQIDAFLTTTETGNDIMLLSGTFPDTLGILSCTKQLFQPMKNDYVRYTSVRYLAKEIPAAHRFVKIILAPEMQLGRIEVKYDEMSQITLSRSPSELSLPGR